VPLVDDEDDAREMMIHMLEQWHATALAVGSADEAVGMIASFQPDIIISDIAMPGRDGFDLIRSLRANDITKPAVALSAFARAEDREHALREGFQLHMSKPINSQQLIDAIVRLLPGRDRTVLPRAICAGQTENSTM